MDGTRWDSMGLALLAGQDSLLLDNTNNYIHRGGEEVLLDVGGQDATEAFEDVGHSDEAREILDGLLVGTLKRGVCCPCPFIPIPLLNIPIS